MPPEAELCGAFEEHSREGIREAPQAGAEIGDPLLRAVLLDDDEGLRRLLRVSGMDIQQKISPLCAFTSPSCRGVSALHLCAESNRYLRGSAG